MLDMLTTNATHIGARAFFIPNSHPVTVNVASEAGAPQTRIEK